MSVRWFCHNLNDGYRKHWSFKWKTMVQVFLLNVGCWLYLCLATYCMNSVLRITLLWCRTCMEIMVLYCDSFKKYSVISRQGLLQSMEVWKRSFDRPSVMWTCIGNYFINVNVDEYEYRIISNVCGYFLKGIIFYLLSKKTTSINTCSISISSIDILLVYPPSRLEYIFVIFPWNKYYSTVHDLLSLSSI